MRYFIYLKRSLTRAWRSHLLLVLLLAVAISLPICLSVIDASRLQGEEAFVYHHTQGHNVRIHDAVPGDEVYFENLRGGIAVWDGDILYVDRTADNPLRFANGNPVSDSFAMEVWQLADGAGRGLSAEILETFMTEIPESCFSPKIWAAVLLFAAVLQGFSCLLFVRRQKPDLLRLRAIGAQKTQLLHLLLAESVLHQLVAAGLSMLFSIGGLKLLYDRFLGMTLLHMPIEQTSSLQWYVFACDYEKICVFLALSMVYALLLHIFLLFYTVLRKKQTRRRHILLQLRKSSRLLHRVFLRNHPLRIAAYILIAVPVLAGAVFLWRMRPTVDTASEYIRDSAITVALQSTEAGRLDSDLEPLRQIPGVAEVSPLYTDNLSYYVLDERAFGTHMSGNTVYHGFQAVLIPDAQMPSPEESEGIYANIDLAECAYLVKNEYGTGQYDLVEQAVGEYVSTYWSRNEEGTGEYDMLPIAYTEAESIELLCFGKHSLTLHIAEVLDADAAKEKRREQFANDPENMQWIDTPGAILYIYLHPEDYEKVHHYREVVGFDVQLTAGTSSQEVVDAIYAAFEKGEIVYLLNSAADQEVAYNRAVGMNLLYTTLSLLLFAFFAIITTLSLIDYAASHADTLRLLHMQGASHRAIVAAFVEIMLPPGILTCAAVWAIVTPVEREYYRLRGYSDAYMPQLGIRLDDPLYLAAALAVVAVFVAPVICTVVRQLRRLDRG